MRNEIEDVLGHVETEASRVPIEAAQGNFGQRQIRNGEVAVQLTPTSPVTFYFDPASVATTSRIATCVRGTNGLNEAMTALNEMELQTEFETERQRLTDS